MGIDNILMNFLAEPELVEIVMDKVLACNLEIVRRAIRAGAEVIILGDDYASNHGPMMSPAVFRHFILPRLQADDRPDPRGRGAVHQALRRQPVSAPGDDRLGRARRPQPHRAGGRHGAEDASSSSSATGCAWWATSTAATSCRYGTLERGPRRPCARRSPTRPPAAATSSARPTASIPRATRRTSWPWSGRATSSACTEPDRDG